MVRVSTATCQSFSIRLECKRQWKMCMPFPLLQQMTCTCVPYPEMSIIICSSDISPIWTKRNRLEGTAYGARQILRRAIPCAPYTNRVGSRCNETTIRRKVDTPDEKILFEDGAYSFAFNLPNLKSGATSIGREVQDMSPSTYFDFTILASGSNRLCAQTIKRAAFWTQPQPQPRSRLPRYRGLPGH
jgi:hypothetical protein